mmetsp:Transcript_122593/g.192341  ORF Transcript_122593/g.192341 Transcript_122593/m.192341 type:complete len:694 (+) Transcript_122593:154-2235(+)
MQADASRPPPPSPASSLSSRGLGQASFSYTAPSMPATPSTSSTAGTCWPSRTASIRTVEDDLVSRRKLASYAAWLAESGVVSKVGARELIRLAQDSSVEDPEASVHRAVLLLIAEHCGSDHHSLACWVVERWLTQWKGKGCEGSSLDLQVAQSLRGKRTITMSPRLYESPCVGRCVGAQQRTTWKSKAAARWLVGVLVEMTKPALQAGLSALREVSAASSSGGCSSSAQICSSTPQPPMRPTHCPSSPHFGMWTSIVPTWWDTGPEEERSWLKDSSQQSSCKVGAEAELMEDSPHLGSAGGSMTDMASPFAKLQSPPTTKLVPSDQRSSESMRRQWAEEGLPLACQPRTKDDDSTVDWLMQRWSLMKQRRRNETSMSPQPSPCKGLDTMSPPRVPFGPPRPGGRWPAGPARAGCSGSSCLLSVNLSSPSQPSMVSQQQSPNASEAQQGSDIEIAWSPSASSTSTHLVQDSPSNLVLENSSILLWPGGQTPSRRPTTARQSSSQPSPAATHASLAMTSSAVALARASAAASRIRASIGSSTLRPSPRSNTTRPASTSPSRASQGGGGSQSATPQGQLVLSPSSCRGAAAWSGSPRADSSTNLPHAAPENGMQQEVAVSSDAGSNAQLSSDLASRSSNQGRSRSASPRALASATNLHDCESASTASSVTSLRPSARMGAASSSCEVFFIGTPRCV